MGFTLPSTLAIAGADDAPEGLRGVCLCVRAGGHFIRGWRAYAGAQREAVSVIALVETRAGLEAIEAICAVEGLLELLIDPFDLSVSLGHAGDYLHPEVQSAIDRMMRAAAAKALPVIAPIFNPDPEEAQRQQKAWFARGATLFVIGTDKILFSDAVRRSAALSP